MKTTLDFRTLTENEVQVRVASINEYGATLSLYKNARIDQQLLDETVGSFNWKREHREIVVGDEIRQSCIVSIWDDEKEHWVPKEDFGSTDFTFEISKATASDSFKRACTNWGIGRELYSAPDIILGTNDYISKVAPNGSITTYDEFKVVSIGYNQERIMNQLTIKNLSTNKIVFNFDVRSDEEKAADSSFAEDEVCNSNPPETKRENTQQAPAVDRPITPIPETEEPAYCDVGGSRIYGKPLAELNPQELAYCFKNTKKQVNKKCALNIARLKPAFGEAFRAAGIEI